MDFFRFGKVLGGVGILLLRYSFPIFGEMISVIFFRRVVQPPTRISVSLSHSSTPPQQ